MHRVPLRTGISSIGLEKPTGYPTRCLLPGTTWYTACVATRGYSRPSGFSTIRATRPPSPVARPAASLLYAHSSLPAPTALLCVATWRGTQASLISRACSHGHHSASSESGKSVLAKEQKLQVTVVRRRWVEEPILGPTHTREMAPSPFLVLVGQDMEGSWQLCWV